MRARLRLLCVSAAISLSMIACANRTASLEVSCGYFQENQHYTGEVTVNTGDSVVVTLCSNPATGFQWTELAEIGDRSMLKQKDHTYSPAEAKEVVAGAGDETWTFEAVSQGTTTVSVEYEQPWEGGAKGHWTFVATITVE